MKKILALALLTVGCAGTPKGWQDTAPRFPEKQRTSYYLGCVMQGAPITHCMCVESTILAKWGTMEKALAEVNPEIMGKIEQQCFNTLKEQIMKEIEAQEAKELETAPQI